MKTTTIALALLLALPLAAQQQPSTAPVEGHDKGRLEHPERTALNDALPTAAAVKEQTGARNPRVWLDATRIGALLRDLQTEVTLSPALWRTIGNEANTLANRLYARTSRNAEARRAATSLRVHVRELRAAALRGDAAGARRHAAEALPFAYALIEWSA